MEIKTLCRNCNHYYVFFDDDGEILTEGCNLDIPFFTSDKPIFCSSYNDK